MGPARLSLPLPLPLPISPCPATDEAWHHKPGGPLGLLTQVPGLPTRQMQSMPGPRPCPGLTPGKQDRVPLRVDVLSDRYEASCLTCGLIVDVDDAHICLPTQRCSQEEERPPTTG